MHNCAQKREVRWFWEGNDDSEGPGWTDNKLLFWAEATNFFSEVLQKQQRRKEVGVKYVDEAE